jgi:hypothetical protein
MARVKDNLQSRRRLFIHHKIVIHRPFLTSKATIQTPSCLAMYSCRDDHRQALNMTIRVKPRIGMPNPGEIGLAKDHHPLRNAHFDQDQFTADQTGCRIS